MPKFIVSGTDLKIKGELYREGSTVELTAAEGMELAQWLTPSTEQASTKASPKTEPTKVEPPKTEGTDEVKTPPAPPTGNTGEKQ